MAGQKDAIKIGDLVRWRSGVAKPKYYHGRVIRKDGAVLIVKRKGKTYRVRNARKLYEDITPFKI